MKRAVTVARIIVGVLFIFSGLVKAIDPLGLVYKMQEFFEAWAGDGHMGWLLGWLHSDRTSIIISSIMIVMEVGLGMAILIGWQKRFSLWALLIISTFFTFLTAYALFSGKVRECGCFGACIPLSPLATFLKDVILLVIIIFIIIKKEYVMPAFKSHNMVTCMLGSVMITAFIQSHAFEHLPYIDCLSYKVGGDILKLREEPADATFDQYTYTFTYKKGAQQKDFDANSLPDSSWQYVSRNQVLVSKGNGKEPAIKDFSLTDANGNDSTTAVLSQPGEYYLFFLRNMTEASDLWESHFKFFDQNVKAKNRKMYIVAGEYAAADSFFNITNDYRLPVYSCDVTALKTAARCTPTIFLMDGPVIKGKWAWLDFQDALNAQ